MKYIVLLSLWLTPLFSFAQNACVAEAQNFYEGIKANYDKVVSTAAINMLKKNIKFCGKTSQEVLGVDDAFLDGMSKESRKREFLRIKDDIDNASQYGSIKQYEAEFAQFSKDAGFTDYQKYFNEKSQQAATSAAYEAQACTSVNMSKEMPPVRNQDSVGWCYAFTAADLASYKLKKTVSAADIALEYQDDWMNSLKRSFKGTSPADIDGGWNYKALDKMSKKGFCLESDLPSEDNSGGTYADTLRNIDRQGRSQIARGSLACTDLHETTKQLFPSATLSDVSAVVQISSEGGFIDGLRDKTCKNRIQADFKVEHFWKEGVSSKARDKVDGAISERNMANIIDQQLSSKNPVSMSIDANAFYNRRTPATNFENMGSHAVTVVGRRFNKKTGQCEYQIRNSWGKGCSSYDTQYECKEGQFWMQKTDLLRRSFGVTYVK